LSQARNAAPALASLQTRTYADKAAPTEVSSILEQRIRGVQEGKILILDWVHGR
jgi:F-type H+-transporting ATPase subunit alpha